MKHAQLIELGACRKGREFAERFDTLNEAWQKCDEPAWMIWYLRRSKRGTKEQFVRIAVFAAEKVLPMFEHQHPNDDRPRKAIEAARGWLDDPTSAAASAAYSAASAASAYAASAAYSAASAAYSAASAVAADASAADAYTASADAYAAADADDRSKLKSAICNVIRQLIQTI